MPDYGFFKFDGTDKARQALDTARYTAESEYAEWFEAISTLCSKQVVLLCQKWEGDQEFLLIAVAQELWYYGKAIEYANDKLRVRER